MSINKHTAKRSNGHISIEVLVERGTWDETIYSDGYDMGQRTHTVNHTTITIRDEQGKVLGQDDSIRQIYATSGKQSAEAIKQGCLGKIGNVFLGPKTHSLVVEAIVEAEANAPKTPKQIEIETAEAARIASAEAYRNSPQGKAEAAAMRRHEALMREMDRPDSDF